MALYGILGGIDGNLEALRVVLAAFDARGVKKILCLGDVVGYNADPDECGELLRARRAFVVAGKHDLVATGRRLSMQACSNHERYALSRTRRELRSDTAAWLRGLPAHRMIDDSLLLVHGVPDVEQLRGAFPAARACFALGDARKVYEADGVQLIVVGTVDAQRKPDHRLAECALYDTDAATVEFLELRYDAAATEAKAAVAGYRILPAMDALLTMQRRAARLPQIAQDLARAVQAFSAELVRRRPQSRSPA